ncbi:unnamed protein product [Alternaria alternata]
MDIIPEPSEAYPGVVVPLLDVIPYIPGAFIDFPSRAGFDLDHVRNGDASALEVATLLQSWLCFGLLQEIWQDHTFIIDNFAISCEQSLTHQALSLAPLKAELRHIERATLDRWQIKCLVEEAQLVLGVFEESPHYVELASPLVEVHLSIQIILELLAEGRTLEFVRDRTLHPLISSRLTKHGWCRSHIRQIEQLESDTLGYYLSRTKFPRRPNVSHEACPETHCTASNSRLAVSNDATNSTLPDAGDYKSAHTHGDSVDCTYVSVDRMKVIQIIRKGKIPLVSIERTSTGEINLLLKEATANDSYIALSHVWSDGLGNPHDNALPKCQLQRLADYLQTLPYPDSHSHDYGRVESHEKTWNFGPRCCGPMYIDVRRFQWNLWRNTNRKLFWMDTLCIPPTRGLQGQDITMAEEAKQRAINQMAMIYGSASQVLVLDYVLLRSRLAVLTQEEIFSRITFSAWMGRSWTLQEGALSPHVYFQCLDGAFCPRYGFSDPHAFDYRLVPLFDHLKALRWFQNLRPLWKDALREQRRDRLKEDFIFTPLLNACARSYFKFGTERTYDVSSFINVWNALTTRTTTMEDDLPAIFANMLQLNAYNILTLPQEQRLHAIVTVSDHLPVSLLYNRGERVRPGENHNGRWIPRVPTHSRLEDLPLMRIDIEHNLVLSNNFDGSNPIFLRVRERVPITTTRLVVITSDGQTLLVAFHRVEEKREDGSKLTDQLDIQPFDAIVILKKANSVEGCCLRTCSDGRKAIYDCPCTVESIDLGDTGVEHTSTLNFSLQPRGLETRTIGLEREDQKKPMPVYEGERVHEWDMVISSMRKPECKPYHRQYALWYLDGSFYIQFLMFGLPYVLLYVAMVPLRIYIATQHPLSNLSVLGWASLLSFFVLRHPQLMPLSPISAVLFIVDAQQSRAGLSGLELSYVIMDFLWCVSIPFIVVWSIHSAERWARDSELAVLKEGWSAPRKYNLMNRWVTHWQGRLQQWRDRRAEERMAMRASGAEDVRGLINAYEMERREST